MKTSRALSVLLMLCMGICSSQEKKPAEYYGNSLNAGIGYTYYRYVGYSVPVWRADYELQMDHHLTVAPFISMYSYSSQYIWGDPPTTEFRTYDYDETVIPLGIKVTRYFDDLLLAGPKWDFYASGSLGYIIRNRTWEAGYTGRKDIEPGTGPMYLDFHLGAEYHLTRSLGLQLDISTGMSTFGLAFHL